MTLLFFFVLFFYRQKFENEKAAREKVEMERRRLLEQIEVLTLAQEKQAKGTEERIVCILHFLTSRDIVIIML